mgnify:CR=1 FL=1
MLGSAFFIQALESGKDYTPSQNESPIYKIHCIKTNEKTVKLTTLVGTTKIGRAHVWTPVTQWYRMPSSAWNKKKTKKTLFLCYSKRSFKLRFYPKYYVRETN